MPVYASVQAHGDQPMKPLLTSTLLLATLVPASAQTTCDQLW
jgi:hypothetical protein